MSLKPYIVYREKKLYSMSNSLTKSQTPEQFRLGSILNAVLTVINIQYAVTVPVQSESCRIQRQSANSVTRKG